jgi:hypothetical protein
MFNIYRSNQWSLNCDNLALCGTLCRYEMHAVLAHSACLLVPAASSNEYAAEYETLFSNVSLHEHQFALH